jgi:anti-sigma factor RsiW
MKCVTKKKLSAYLDGELGSADHKAITEHLKRCERCHLLARELAAVSETLDLLEGLEPEPFFAAEVKKKVLSVKPVRGWRRVMVPILASAAAAVSIVLGVFFGQAIYSGLQAAEYGTDTVVTTYLRYSPAQDYPDGSLGDAFNDIAGGYE